MRGEQAGGCLGYRSHVYGAKKVTLGISGLEDDFDICKRIFLYAYDCVKARCKEIKAEHDGLGYNGSDIREMCNAYGWGFCNGLSAAFRAQEEQHQEWGLVMVVPQAVEKVTEDMGKPSSYTNSCTGGWRKRYAAAGYQDGREFDPAHRLAGQDAMKAIK